MRRFRRGEPVVPVVKWRVRGAWFRGGMWGVGVEGGSLHTHGVLLAVRSLLAVGLDAWVVVASDQAEAHVVNASLTVWDACFVRMAVV